MDPAKFAAVQEELRERCRRFGDLGADFEALTEMLLRELGFIQVQQQSSGSQYGRDFSAFRDTNAGRESWFFECKNLERNVDVTMAAEKLIHHLHRNLAAFVIIGPSQLSNDLRDLLAASPFSFEVLDWTGENFVKAILACPTTRRRWFPDVDVDVSDSDASTYRSQIFAGSFPPARPLEIRLEPRDRPPYQKAFFLVGDELHEYDTDLNYQHALVLHNRGRGSIIVTSITVTTLSYRPLPQRLLVQMKMKGAYEPLTLVYRPSREPGDFVELLRGRMRQLQPGETEVHFTTLDGARLEGVYHLRVHASYLCAGQERREEVRDLRLCVCSSTLDPPSIERMRLWTWRGHYPGLARVVLARPDEELARIVALMGDNKLVYLGPVPHQEIGAGPENKAHARITIIPLNRVSETTADLLLEQATTVFDWGPSPNGESGPDDPHVEMRSKAEVLGLSLEEYARLRVQGLDIPAE